MMSGIYLRNLNEPGLASLPGKEYVAPKGATELCYL